MHVRRGQSNRVAKTLYRSFLREARHLSRSNQRLHLSPPPAESRWGQGSFVDATFPLEKLVCIDF